MRDAPLDWERWRVNFLFDHPVASVVTAIAVACAYVGLIWTLNRRVDAQSSLRPT
jgi:hypothetical protein